MSKMPVQFRAIVRREMIRGVIAWACGGLIVGAMVGAVLIWTFSATTALTIWAPVVGMFGAAVGVIVRLIGLRMDPVNERILVGRLDERLGTRDTLSSILDPVSGDGAFVRAAREASIEAWRKLEPKRLVTISPHHRLVHACVASCLILAGSWLWRFDRHHSGKGGNDPVASLAGERGLVESSDADHSEAEERSSDMRARQQVARTSDDALQSPLASTMASARTERREGEADGEADAAQESASSENSTAGAKSDAQADSARDGRAVNSTTADAAMISGDRAIVDSSVGTPRTSSLRDETRDRQTEQSESTSNAPIASGLSGGADDESSRRSRGVVSALDGQSSRDGEAMMKDSEGDQTWEAARERARLQMLSGRVPASALRLVRAYFDRAENESTLLSDGQIDSESRVASDGAE